MSEEVEQQTGWRPVFKCLPNSKATTYKMTLPLGVFCSPLLPQCPVYGAAAPKCERCGAAITPSAVRNRSSKQWGCSFCKTPNPYPHDFPAEPVQEFVDGKDGECGILFVVDLCQSAVEVEAVKAALTAAIASLPRHLFVGLVAFHRHVQVLDLLADTTAYVCLNGQSEYSSAQVKEVLLPAQTGRVSLQAGCSPYYVQGRQECLLEAVRKLKADGYEVPREERERRALGCALRVATSIAKESNVASRVAVILGGACTVGMGQVVDVLLTKTFRTYSDIFETKENTEFMKGATAFYDGLAEELVKSSSTADLWACGLEQFGLMEMRKLAQATGGVLTMQESFTHFVFQTSFPRCYGPNEEGILNCAFGARLSLHLSRELQVNGVLGQCLSLRENASKQAASMEIGEGGTTQWYLGGPTAGNSFCVFLALADGIDSASEKVGLVQAVATYKLSDNYRRTRVLTLSLPFLGEQALPEIARRFDEEAAAVALARLAATKADVEEPTEVKKWLDRLLLKFMVRFARFHRGQVGSFRLQDTLRGFPQLIYHLRRSGFINIFGFPPDQVVHIKACLLRESVANCAVMVQPALLRYSIEGEPSQVELDIDQLTDDALLLLDCFFYVVLWQGDHVRAWHESNLRNDPEYEHLHKFFEVPRENASEIMYDRLPCSNFYETHKDDGNERYIKARVNPSRGKSEESDGHFVTDDAALSVFMEFLIRSVVNYSE